MAPAGGSTTETINDSKGNGNGSIYIDSTLLTGPATVISFSGTKNVWTAADGTTYQFTPIGADGIGTLSITLGGELAASGDQIVIQDFNLNQAQQPSGYLGIP